MFTHKSINQIIRIYLIVSNKIELPTKLGIISNFNVFSCNFHIVYSWLLLLIVVEARESDNKKVCTLYINLVFGVYHNSL